MPKNEIYSFKNTFGRQGDVDLVPVKVQHERSVNNNIIDFKKIAFTIDIKIMVFCDFTSSGSMMIFDIDSVNNAVAHGLSLTAKDSDSLFFEDIDTIDYKGQNMVQLSKMGSVVHLTYDVTLSLPNTIVDDYEIYEYYKTHMSARISTLITHAQEEYDQIYNKLSFESYTNIKRIIFQDIEANRLRLIGASTKASGLGYDLNHRDIPYSLMEVLKEESNTVESHQEIFISSSSRHKSRELSIKSHEVPSIMSIASFIPINEWRGVSNDTMVAMLAMVCMTLYVIWRVLFLYAPRTRHRDSHSSSTALVARGSAKSKANNNEHMSSCQHAPSPEDIPNPIKQQTSRTINHHVKDPILGIHHSPIQRQQILTTLDLELDMDLINEDGDGSGEGLGSNQRSSTPSHSTRNRLSASTPSRRCAHQNRLRQTITPFRRIHSRVVRHKRPLRSPAAPLIQCHRPTTHSGSPRSTCVPIPSPVPTFSIHVKSSGTKDESFAWKSRCSV